MQLPNPTFMQLENIHRPAPIDMNGEIQLLRTRQDQRFKTLNRSYDWYSQCDPI